MGDVHARYSLGYEEEKARNIGRAKKHYMIAAKDGHETAVKKMLKLYSKEYATKRNTRMHYELIKNMLPRLRLSRGMMPPNLWIGNTIESRKDGKWDTNEI